MNNTQTSIDFLWSAILGSALQRGSSQICAELIDDYLEAYYEDASPDELEQVKDQTIAIWEASIDEVEDDFESFTITRWAS